MNSGEWPSTTAATQHRSWNDDETGQRNQPYVEKSSCIANKHTKRVIVWTLDPLAQISWRRDTHDQEAKHKGPKQRFHALKLHNRTTQQFHFWQVKVEVVLNPKNLIQYGPSN